MEFKLPDIGEGVHEGEITKWLVKAGDPIKADQPMVEVMTDKATVEIPSPVNGVVKELVFPEGQTVEVGKVIVRIDEGGNGKSQSTPAPMAQEAQSKPQPPKAPAAPPREREVEPITDDVIPFHILATPATRKLARDLKVDLKNVKGTGLHGRVTKLDVQMTYEGHSAAEPRSTHPVAASSPSTSVATRTTPVRPLVTTGAVTRVPLKGVRKKIAEAMSHSKHTAAHFTYVEEVDMSEIVRLRAQHAEEAKNRGLKLTFLPFIMKALVPALQEFPYMNSSLDDEKQEIVLKGDYNLGVATDTPQGLMVPVIKHVDSKSIWQLAQEILELSEKARTGKMSLEDLKGGTFTVTNAGNIGGVFATPVINHPEVAILGVNAIRKRPVVKEDQIVIRDMMFLSISVDHRVVDGADAARFMNRLIYFLQDPIRLVFA